MNIFVQDLKWRTDERVQTLTVETERLNTALQQAEMEARVQVAKAEAATRAAQVDAESTRSELSLAISQARLPMNDDACMHVHD